MFGFKRVVGAITQYLTAGYYGEFLNSTLPLWSLIVEDGLYACVVLLFVFGVHRKAWVTLPILAALVVTDRYITDLMVEYRFFHTSIAFFTGNLVFLFHDRLRNISWLWPALVVGAFWTGRLGFLDPPPFRR